MKEALSAAHCLLDRDRDDEDKIDIRPNIDEG